MGVDNRVVLVPAVNGFRASPASYYGTAAVGGAAGGPAGSASMVFFCVMYPARVPASGITFGRTNTLSGWYITSNSSSILQVRAFNSTPAGVSASVAGSVLTLEGENVPYLILGSYQNGTMSGWMNGVAMGAPVTLGTGFTSFAGPTAVGIRSSSNANNWVYGPLADCGLLDAYDVAGYVDPIFGNGGPGLSARWNADLREGRYLTWPRAAVANSDWYWAGRDAVVGINTVGSWVDRFSATALLKFGQPQGAAFPARPT